MMIANDVRNMLRKACDKAGGITAWARENKVSVAYVSDVINGRREPGPAVCRAFDLEAVVHYRKIRGDQ
jgi:hypothetical protein